MNNTIHIDDLAVIKQHFDENIKIVVQPMTKERAKALMELCALRGYTMGGTHPREVNIKSYYTSYGAKTAFNIQKDYMGYSEIGYYKEHSSYRDIVMLTLKEP